MEKFTVDEWLRLHNLRVSQVTNIVESYTYSTLFDPCPEEFTVVESAEELWQAYGAAMLEALPELREVIQKTVLETTRFFSVSGIENPETTYCPKTHSVIVKMDYGHDIWDALHVAHEFGHAIQYHAMGQKFVPPIIREAAAFLCELIVIDALLDQDHGLAQAMDETRYDAGEFYCFDCGNELITAISRMDAPYRYSLNYPVARALADHVYSSERNISDVFYNRITVGAVIPTVNALLDVEADLKSGIDRHTAVGLTVLADLEAEHEELERSIGVYWRARFHATPIIYFDGKGHLAGYDALVDGTRVFSQRFGDCVSALRADDTMPCTPPEHMLTTAYTLGCTLHMLAESEYHCNMPIGVYLEEDVLPPLRLGQIKIFTRQAPYAIVTWGFLSNPRLEAILDGRRTVEIDDWASGDQLMIHDVIAPYGDLRDVMMQMKSDVFPDHKGVSIRRAADGTIQRINHWRGVNVRRNSTP